jgi:hypothetical protein
MITARCTVSLPAICGVTGLSYFCIVRAFRIIVCMADASSLRCSLSPWTTASPSAGIDEAHSPPCNSDEGSQPVHGARLSPFYGCERGAYTGRPRRVPEMALVFAQLSGQGTNEFAPEVLGSNRSNRAFRGLEVAGAGRSDCFFLTKGREDFHGPVLYVVLIVMACLDVR